VTRRQLQFFDADGVNRFFDAPSAEFSACRRYRYLLRWPTGLANKRRALLIGANPSTATAEQLDPTLRRWLRYCSDWGYGWSWTVNVRAWRETDPRKIPPDPEAIGPANDEWLMHAAHVSDLVVCGWGKLGGQRGAEVLDMLRASGVVPHALRLNADGSPTHLLYLPASLTPVPIPEVRP